VEIVFKDKNIVSLVKALNKELERYERANAKAFHLQDRDQLLILIANWGTSKLFFSVTHLFDPTRVSLVLVEKYIALMHRKYEKDFDQLIVDFAAKAGGQLAVQV